MTGPLRDRSRPIEEICAGCALLPTKPGALPNALASLIIQAYRMEALFESHAGGDYPDFWTPAEWEAFLSLKYARSKDQEKDFPKRRDGAQASAQAKLETRMRQN